VNTSSLSLLRRTLRALLRRHDGPAPRNREGRPGSEAFISFSRKGHGARPDTGEYSHPPAEAFDNSERAEISFGPAERGPRPNTGEYSHPPAEAYDNSERAGRG
jgi:hypothetical protein